MEKRTNNPNPSIAQKAFDSYRKQAKALLPTAFNFTMVLIAVFALGFYYPPSLYLTVPLIILPFLFAFQMCAAYLRKGSEVSNSEFGRFLLSYFQAPFAGCYRVIIHLLYSFLWALLATWATSFIYYGIASAVSPEFLSAVNDITTMVNNGSDSIAISNAILASLPLSYFVNTVAAVELSVFCISFFHLTAAWGMSPYLRGAMPGGDSRMCNAVFLGGIRQVRKAFWKDYYRSLWLGDVLFLVGYFGGGAIALLFSAEATLWVCCGLIGAAILLLPFLPYYFHVMGFLLEKYHNAFATFAIQLANDTLKELEQTKRLSEEEAAAIKKSIAEAEAAEEEAKKDEKDPSADSPKEKPDGTDDKNTSK
jgi:hypothetical protein